MYARYSLGIILVAYKYFSVFTSDYLPHFVNHEFPSFHPCLHASRLRFPLSSNNHRSHPKSQLSAVTDKHRPHVPASSKRSFHFVLKKPPFPHLRPRFHKPSQENAAHLSPLGFPRMPKQKQKHVCIKERHLQDLNLRSRTK